MITSIMESGCNNSGLTILRDTRILYILPALHGPQEAVGYNPMNRASTDHTNVTTHRLLFVSVCLY